MPTLATPLVAGLVLVVTALSSCGDAAHPTAAVGRKPAARTGPAAHLLAADKMPAVGGEWAGTDTAASDEVLGPCHLTSLVDIGALEAARRTWTVAASVPRAVQVVARFADPKSAWRAHQVLDSWHTDCADRVAGSAKVGDRRAVDVPTGSAEAYRVTQGDRSTDLGILRKGEYLALVSVLGPTSADAAPVRTALKRVAGTF